MTTLTPQQTQTQAEELTTAIQVLGRLRLALDQAYVNLTSDDAYWLVWEIEDEEAHCQSFQELSALAAKVVELQAFKPRLFLFRGQRLRLQSKPYLAIVDGAREIQLEQPLREYLGEDPPVDEHQAAPAPTEEPQVPPIEPAYAPSQVAVPYSYSDLESTDEDTE
jgi:hypothetical protein